MGREDAALLLDSSDIFEPLGFEIEDFGGGTVWLAASADMDTEDLPPFRRAVQKHLSGRPSRSLGVRDGF